MILLVGGAAVHQSGQESYTEAPALAHVLKAPQIFWNGRLWGTHWDQPTVTIYDGATVTLGGKTVVPRKPFAPSLFGTSVGIFVGSRGKQCILHYNKVKQFKLGEKIHQSFTAAVGQIIQDDGKYLSLEVSTGTFDSRHQIEGLTSKASASVVGMTVNSPVNFLEWSPDGYKDFEPVFTRPGLTAPILPHQLCDCGVIKGPIRGYSNTHVLLYGDYSEGNPSLFYCLPDVDPHNWTLLMTGSGVNITGGQNSESIRHFHGEEFVPGIGPNEGRLFVFTGDGDTQSSILCCDDVADLCNNGAKWSGYWAMNYWGTGRVNYLTTGPGKNYCVAAGNQSYRTVELMIDASKKFGYYIPDQPDITNGNPNGTNTLHILDLNNKTIQATNNRVTGTGWVGSYAPDGTILLSTDSEFGFFPTPGVYNGNCDMYCHLYALGADNASLYEIAKFQRGDWQNPVGSVQIDRWPLAFGTLFAWDTVQIMVGGDHAGTVARGPFNTPSSNLNLR